MSSNFQYKTSASGSWAPVPDLSQPDENGFVRVVYPQPSAISGLGLPCGAVGDPKITIKASEMQVGAVGAGTPGSGTGMLWWQNWFTSDPLLYVPNFYITAFNERSGTWDRYKGYLCRPVFGDPVYDGPTMIYKDVVIEVLKIAPAS